MATTLDIVTFEGGLVTELVEPRHTILTHGRGCRQATGFICWPQGPAMTGPGYEWMGSTKTHGAVRLLRVTYSETYSYLCEFGDSYVRFYTNDGQILDGAAAYEVVSPFDEDEVWDLQVCSDAGTLYLWHPDHAPYRLVYTSETSWVLEAVPFEWGPFRDPNLTAVTIAPSATTGDITLTASAATFYSDHVGAPWMLGHRVGEMTLAHSFTANESSSWIDVPKGASFLITSSGSWTASLTLQKTYDAGVTIEAVTTMSPYGDNNFDDAPGAELLDDAEYRFTMTGYVSGTCGAVLSIAGLIAYGYATITAVNSTLEAEATVVEDFDGTTATDLWAEGAWSPRRGYPRCGALVENRLTSIATAADPTTLWLSRSADHVNMRTGETASDALTFSLLTGRGDPFRWCHVTRKNINIGTPSAILELQALSPGSGLSNTNPLTVAQRIELGTSSIPPVAVNSTLIFMGPDNKRPMHTFWEWQQSRFLAPDLAWFCPGLTAPGIKQMAYQATPFPLLWYLRTDGVLLAQTYEERIDQTIVGFSKLPASGTVESICVMPSGEGPRLWRVVARTIDGSTQRHIERSGVLTVDAERATAHRLEAAIEFDGGAAATISAIAIDGVTDYVTVTTTAAHGFSDGDNIWFDDVAGMTWLNRRALTVADAAGTTFAVKTTGGDYVLGTYLSAWTAGGTVKVVENVVTGADHLEGEEAYALADGRLLGPLTVAAGTVTLPRYANRIFLGLAPPAAVLQPLRIMVPTTAGSTQGRQMNVPGLWISLFQSFGGKVGRDMDHLEPIRMFDAAASAVNEAAELVTDDFVLRYESSFSADPTVLIVQDRPLPLTVRGLALYANITGIRSFSRA